MKKLSVLILILTAQVSFGEAVGYFDPFAVSIAPGRYDSCIQWRCSANGQTPSSACMAFCARHASNRNNLNGSGQQPCQNGQSVGSNGYAYGDVSAGTIVDYGNTVNQPAYGNAINNPQIADMNAWNSAGTTTVWGQDGSSGSSSGSGTVVWGSTSSTGTTTGTTSTGSTSTGALNSNPFSN